MRIALLGEDNRKWARALHRAFFFVGARAFLTGLNERNIQPVPG